MLLSSVLALAIVYVASLLYLKYQLKSIEKDEENPRLFCVI